MFLSSLSGLVPEELPWVSLYWLFALVSLGMVVVILASRFPEVERKEDEKVGILETLALLKKPTVWLFFLGIFCYVGSEQGVDRKSTRLNSSHVAISYAVFCL